MTTPLGPPALSTAAGPARLDREPFELIIGGGRVVDPAQEIDARLDVGIANGRVVALAPRLSGGSRARRIEVDGRLVTPGLIDLHTHVYAGVSSLGIEVDQECLKKGVTTSVDAGTAGSFTFPGLRDYVIRRARSRVLAFVNLGAIGLLLDDGLELGQMRYVEPDALGELIEANRDVCLGVKVRMSINQTAGVGLLPLERALEVGARTATRLMVHITGPGVPLEAIFERLRPGDIVTHLYHGRGQTIVDPPALAALRRARARGVRTDVGHGGGSFTFATARAALDSGITPDTISTDLHTISIKGPCYDLPTTMSKFVALGLPLRDVIAATTAEAARSIGRASEIGSLEPGRTADLAVLELEDGIFAYADVAGETLTGAMRLRPWLTVRAGEVVAGPPAPGESPSLDAGQAVRA